MSSLGSTLLTRLGTSFSNSRRMADEFGGCLQTRARLYGFYGALAASFELPLSPRPPGVRDLVLYPANFIYQGCGFAFYIVHFTLYHTIQAFSLGFIFENVSPFVS